MATKTMNDIMWDVVKSPFKSSSQNKKEATNKKKVTTRKMSGIASPFGGPLPSTVIKLQAEKKKKESANKKKVAANAKKVAENKKKVQENKKKVAYNASDIALAKLLKSKTPLKKAQMGADMGTVSMAPEAPSPTNAQMKKGGSTDKKWIQKAINPKHKGYCTPMTKPTCTPKRKALAKTLKAMAKNRKG